MKNIILIVAAFLLFTSAAITADAQKKYTEGTITLKTEMGGQDVAITEYFNPEFLSIIVTSGPATITQLVGTHLTYALLFDIPVAGVKKAAIFTPGEIEQEMSSVPTFKFATTTETRQISGFNCKKVVATDTTTKKTYDVWITNDLAVPDVAVPSGYRSIGGVPVQYTAFQAGRQPSLVTMSSISDAKPPKGAFEIPADFQRISKADLEGLSGGH